MPLPLASVPCVSLSVFVSLSGRPRLKVAWLSYCSSTLIAFDFLAEVGCHLNACLTSFVSTIRPMLNQGSSYFPAAVTLLVLYSPAQSVLRLHWDFRDGVWIVYGLLDCVSFVQIDKLFDCWSHVSNLPFTYIKIWQLLAGVSMWPPSKKGGEGGCYKVVSTDNMNKNCKGDNLGVFFVILTAASWLVDRIAVYPLTSG